MRLLVALNLGRVLVGLGHVVAPAAVGGQWIGRTAKDPAAQVMVRAFGIRDLALGVATLGSLRSTGIHGRGVTVLAALGMACDAVDAAATLQAGDSLPKRGRPTVAIAGTAVASAALALARR